jgi:Protein of unknown function (DUF3572)
MNVQETNDERAAALALSALSWTLSEPERAQRLLGLTGLTPEDLRHRLGEPDLLAAVLRFLEAHEPDLLACAEALDIPPGRIPQARADLER